MSYYPMGFPQSQVKWKGKTFNQIVATIQKNDKKIANLTITQLRKPLPLKIYRRELTATGGCNSRASIKIAHFEIPGNNTVSEKASGLVNTLDIYPTTISSEHGGCNGPNACFFSPDYNARKRCRSAGMITRKFNPNKNNDTYCTSTNQYLVARNRTIKQNEFNYIRKGDSGIIPGSALSASNIYSPAGLSHCYKPLISPENNNNVITYIWIDGSTRTATIPTGMYDIQLLNTAFQTQQLINKTYLKGSLGNPDVFLLSISYDNKTNSAILIANATGQDVYSNMVYSAPSGADWDLDDDTNPEVKPVLTGLSQLGGTYFIIRDTDQFGELIGFSPGTYFNGINTTPFQGTLSGNYVALYYKPNNPLFGVQGAVDSSTLIHRKKYDTITSAAYGLRSAYGDGAANALAYGVSEKPYTIKSVVGDKVIYSPFVDKNGNICPKRFIYRR
jgi:hypothetical protein